MNKKLLNYLKEKEEYFFQEDEPEDSEPDYNLDFVNDKIPEEEIEVEEIPDNSDKVHKSDDFMYSNSDAVSYYSKGNGFKVNDNQEFYEVIKLVKDVTDKHLYVRNLKWKSNIKDKKVEFDFILGDDVSNKDSNDFFMNGIEQHLMLNIFKKFGSIFIMKSFFYKDSEEKNVLKITLERNKEKRLDTSILTGKPIDSSGLYGKYTSISTI